jgi:inosine-uridine nucleoside N-ribohydrolase
MERIIIDTDGGVDDALALLLALGWPGVQIEAITTVYGNVALEAATRNVGEVLHVAGTERIVARGCSAPLATAVLKAPEVHGYDGLGGWTAIEVAHPPSVCELPAWKLIPSLARQSPGAVTLVTIGPLTNAARAAREDPDGLRMLKQIVTMGGAIWEPGNITNTAEFNIYADPEAAREIFRCGVPSVLVGLDVTRKVVLTRERLTQLLGDRSDLRARFLHCVCNQLFSFYQTVLGTDMFYLHDPLAVGAAIDRSLVETQLMSVDIETSGELTRGMVVAERRGWVPNTTNVEVCVKVDSERFLDKFCEYAAGDAMSS